MYIVPEAVWRKKNQPVLVSCDRRKTLKSRIGERVRVWGEQRVDQEEKTFYQKSMGPRRRRRYRRLGNARGNYVWLKGKIEGVEGAFSEMPSVRKKMGDQNARRVRALGAKVKNRDAGMHSQANGAVL